MISSGAAYDQVMEHVRGMHSEQVTLGECTGRVLDEDVLADRNFPPFDRVMMDGIAISCQKYAEGRREFKIEGMQTAGIDQLTLESSSNCIEVMTGAILPKGTDAVVRYEDVETRDSTAFLASGIDVEMHQNVHKEATDRRKGEVIIPAGRLIRPPEVAVLSTVGKSRVRVKATPKVAIVSTGDELVDVHDTPKTFQIRRSNGPSIDAHLRSIGIESNLFHINDDKENLKGQLEEILKGYEIVILSGGVSRGKKDFVPEVLTELNVRKLFHRVSQRPGKPFWFGVSESAAVFALPGNPVSTFMCFHKYTAPFIKAMMGLKSVQEFARLTEDFVFEPDLTYFLQVRLESRSDGVLMAQPVPGQGSGDLANLVEADAFLELPREKSLHKAGDSFPIFRY